MGLRDRIRAKVESVKAEVIGGLTEALADNPEALREMEEAGLLSRQRLAALSSTGDLSAVVTEFRTGIIDLIRDKPSAMASLDVRPLELMVDEAPPSEGGPTGVLAVLFSDLEGFTSFNADRGDAEAAALLRDHYDAVSAIVRGRGGTVIKTIGDGHMMSFATSAAAVLAGLDLIDGAPSPLRLRVGGHFGPVIRVEGDLLGNVVNLAARVTDLANGGQQMATMDLRNTLGDLPGVVFSTPRTESVKGVGEPVQVCEVLRG